MAGWSVALAISEPQGPHFFAHRSNSGTPERRVLRRREVLRPARKTCADSQRDFTTVDAVLALHKVWARRLARWARTVVRRTTALGNRRRG